MPQFNKDPNGVSEAGGSAPLYGSVPTYQDPSVPENQEMNFWEMLGRIFTGGGYQPGAPAQNGATSPVTQAELNTQAVGSAAEFDDFSQSLDPTVVKNPYGTNIWNQIGGATDQMKWSSWEAANARTHATEERIAAQVYNSAEAMRARDWQEYMDSTAVQRRLNDLAAAGINPLYMFTGSGVGIGSSGGGGSAASVSPGSSAAASSGANGATAVNALLKTLGTVITGIIKAAA